MGNGREAISFVLYHTACPKCREEGSDRSGDNLAVYSDGHTYCFRGHGVLSIGNISGRVRASTKKSSDGEFTAAVRSDQWSTTIPARPFGWLKSYGLTLDEILDSRIQWDGGKELLIFPVYDPNGNLVMYQGRYFGPNPEYPKYITYGSVTDCFNIHWNDNRGSICIVEDFVSAIKVSRALTSMPMWGSSLNLKQIKQLSRMFKGLVWWVDPDKQSSYPGLMAKAGYYFDSVKCVISDNDPKFYLKEEICSKLGM